MKEGMKSKGILKEGLKNMSPEAPKEKAKGPNVARDATRSSTAPTPKTLGSRTA